MKFFNNIKFTKKRLIITGIILILVGIFFYIKSRNKDEVVTTQVQRGTVKEEMILSGVVKAEKHATLSFPTSGKISWVGVTDGNKVYKGQPLISLDKVVLNSAYQQALNNYRNYQAAAESALDSVKGHSGDETFVQRASRTLAEVARDNAYDALKAAKYNLDNATIYSPFPGVISYLGFINTGVNVSLTDSVVEVLDPETIYFEVEADQNDVIKIKEGEEVTVVLDAINEIEFTGEVTYVSITPIQSQTETVYRIKVKLKDLNKENQIRVGMSGDARFILSQKQDVLYAPVRFVNSDKKGRFVNLGKEGNKVYIEIGIEGEDVIEIQEGVKEGDTLYD